MARSTRDHYAALTAQVAATLDAIGFQRFEHNSQRTLWEIYGTWGKYNIRLKEIYSAKGRMYSFYAILANNVVIGFDNYPDRQALYAKYQEAYASHLDELVPHKHTANKETLELTEAMTVDKFLDYLCKEIPQPQKEPL